jgi:hypothetical protein
MPCAPGDISLNVSGGTPVPVPGFGTPFGPGIPDWDVPVPPGFPEDLLDLFNTLQLILPSNTIQPALSANYGKDVLDAILSLLDKAFPIMSLYKLFLPLLEMIICIIEVICAIPNPFKLISKIQRLFRVCLPNFLSLFPQFALIALLLSLLFLLIALIEYILAQILALVALLLQNIAALAKAFQYSDEVGVLAITNKLSEILCAFQNLFVLLAVFQAIITIIKAMINMFFFIPPCDDQDNGNPDKCCSPDVCPAFIRNNNSVSGTTGDLQYFPKVALDANLTAVLPSLPPGFLISPTRLESWQFYDPDATIQNAIYNITNAYDLPTGTHAIFFPVDGNYSATTDPSQAPYTIDLRLFYNPSTWDHMDPLGPRYIRITGCIVLAAPTQNLTTYNNGTTTITNGVVNIQGGTAYEDDGYTAILLNGFPATLNTLLHQPDEISILPIPLQATDGYLFQDLSYTLNINHSVLLSKALITLGCIPDVTMDRTFVNTVFGNAGVNMALLQNLALPDVGAAQQCMTNALLALRHNISTEQVSAFQSATTACLNTLQNSTTAAISDLVGIGFDQYHSTFTITPNTQFTTESIAVQVALNESNGQSMTLGMPASIGPTLASQITANPTLGQISPFTYDGQQFFNATLTSSKAGPGTISIAFDGKFFSTLNLPVDTTLPPSITQTVLPYTFIYSPISTSVSTPEGDTLGKPRFDASDVADSGDNE